MSTSPTESTASLRLGDLFLATFNKLISIQPGERVLDLAVRDGAAAFDAARRIGEEGELLALDSDGPLLERFSTTARTDGMTWVRTEVGDARASSGRDSYWDVVICHLGFPQLAEPDTSLKEALRVLRPVGRLGISSWGQRDRCPLITLFLEAVAPFVPAAKELDRALFRYGEAGRLANTLAEAGFEDATPERLTEWPFFHDIDDYWTAISTDSRFAGLTTGLDAEQVRAAKATLESRSKFYRRRNGLEIKVEGIVLAAVK